MAKTIKMVREADGLVADVHPKEVENYEAAGWEKGGKSGSSPAKKAATVDTEKLVAKVTGLKKADLYKFVKKQGLNIDLDDFSNQSERKSAVIALLKGK